jgi:hypothetical protein
MQRARRGCAGLVGWSGKGLAYEAGELGDEQAASHKDCQEADAAEEIVEPALRRPPISGLLAMISSIAPRKGATAASALDLLAHGPNEADRLRVATLSLNPRRSTAPRRPRG